MMFLHLVGLAVAAASGLLILSGLALIVRAVGWLVRVLTWLGRI